MYEHSLFFVDKVETINFCNTQIYGITGSAFALPFETIPTKGSHDYSTCKNCQDNLNKIESFIKIKFDKFPNCCPSHSKLEKEIWFNKNAFGNIPLIVANKVIFTIQHIINNLNKESWYKEIRDYIEWTVLSFGQIPKGYGGALYLSDYLKHIKHMVETNSGIPETKKAKISEFINSYLIPETTKIGDSNILFSTYDKWYKAFPFEISYFKEMKEHFAKHIPILKGEIQTNPYTGLSYAKQKTPFELITSLVEITKNLLASINGFELYKKGKLTNAENLQLELINANRRNEINELLEKPCNDRPKYIKVIKEWLRGEKEYFKEITPILNNLKKDDTPAKAEKEQPKSNEGTPEPETIILEFDNADLDSYFLSYKIEGFKAIEKDMIQKGFFILEGEKKGSWNKEKFKLVSFILILKKLNFFKTTINNKTGENALREHRRFFEKRYGEDILELFKPTKRKARNLQKHIKFDFSFIPEIDKI